MLDDVPRILRLTAEDRLIELRNAARLFAAAKAFGTGAFDPTAILRILAQHKVRYILGGTTAARLQGYPRIAEAAEITPASDLKNLTHTASAMRSLNARVYTESVPEGLAFEFDQNSLARSKLWNLITDAGRVDLIFKPSGTGGFEDLAQGSIRFEVFGIELQVASLKDIVRSKCASNRPQDQQDVIVLMQMLEGQ